MSASTSSPSKSDNDPIRELGHTHDRVSARVLELGALLTRLEGRSPGRGELQSALSELVQDLREEILLHFAREEEGLFPYVREHVPAQQGLVDRLVAAHDGLCGAVLRLSHLAEPNPSLPVAALRAVFEHFEHLHAQHSRDEAELLQNLGRALDARQRREVADLVRGL